MFLSGSLKTPASVLKSFHTARLCRSMHGSAVRSVSKQVSPSPVATPPVAHATGPRKRVVVGITGATGSLYAIRLLEVLRELNIETHLVMSKWALATLKYETPLKEPEIRALASYSYAYKDIMKTLAAVRIGFCDDLISRAADVCLKERRNLMLVTRETPFSDVHLENMLYLRRAGATIFPPVPAFYTRPQSIEDLVDQSVGRMLDSFGIHTDGFERWTGFQRETAKS